MTSLRPDDRERGFALPAAIFALVVVAFLITAGIHLANQESRIGFATERATRAFYVAETGLQQTMSEWIPHTSGLTEWGPPVLRAGSTPQGDWTVDISRVDEFLFFIRSTGSVEAGGGAQAVRAVGQLGRVLVLQFNAAGAMTVPGGVHSSGVGAVPKVDGFDETEPAWASQWGMFCPAESDMPGVVTDDATLVTCVGGPPGCTAQYQGEPPVHEDGDAVVDQWDHINGQWDDFVAYATHVVPPGNYVPGPVTATDDDGNEWCDTSVLLNWGNPEFPSQLCGDHFPLIYVPGNLRLEGEARGQGILLVEGDLRMVGNSRFDGIVLVRGEFTAGSGTPMIKGSLLAGSAGTLDGTAWIQYSSCAITQAINMNNTARLRPLGARSWVDLTGAAF
jgi:hypothetical protein